MYRSHKPFRKQTVQLQTIVKIKPFYKHQKKKLKK